MAHSSANPFKWRQHKGKLILLCIRWYLTFTLSLSFAIIPSDRKTLPCNGIETRGPSVVKTGAG
jgi:hypothetical protein